MSYVATQIEVDQKVADSAKVCDEEFPGWENDVDLGPGFSISRPENCLLSQLTGSYNTAFTNLVRERPYEDGLQGFACTADEDELFIRAWKHEVEKRKTDNRTEFLTERVQKTTEIPVLTTGVPEAVLAFL